MSFVFFILCFLFLFFFAWLFSFICSVLFPYFFHAYPCPTLERRNNPGPLHVGYRIRALYLREHIYFPFQLAFSSYAVMFFPPCTCIFLVIFPFPTLAQPHSHPKMDSIPHGLHCTFDNLFPFRVHLPSLLRYSLPRSLFLFVSSSLFPVLLYFLVASLPFLGQGERAMARRQNRYSRVWCRLYTFLLSPCFNRCNFLFLSLFFFLLHFWFQLPPACSFPCFYSLSVSSSLFLFVLALFLFLAHAPTLSNVFLVLVYTRRN